ncbi:MAG: transcription antitermination factor NusB [Bacteroidales bacterium]|nr:transcription antitermination factor NusB [Bacteroidales bacterium]
MLSRHFLRSKVLQIIYSGRYESVSDANLSAVFEYHIGKLNELGVLQVSLLPAVADAAGRILEEGKGKFRPTEDDLNPNPKLAHNEFIRRMADNFELKQCMEKWCNCWKLHDNLVREAFLDFRQRPEYKEYLEAEPGFETDKDFAVFLFRYLMNREALCEMIASRSLLWEDDFDQIAQYNFMMLKTLEEDTFDEAMMWPLMYDRRREKDEEDMTFARQLLRDTLACREESDELARRYLQGWEFERVSRMDILLINMAVAEFTGCPTIPEKVTVDEYIELSKEFSSDRSRLFINGILDRMVLELRSRGRINKTGRGLIDYNLNTD